MTDKTLYKPQYGPCDPDTLQVLTVQEECPEPPQEVVPVPVWPWPVMAILIVSMIAWVGRRRP